MPKSYTDKERESIINNLRAAALDSMMKYGVRRTTVDDLVKAVHIPKGTFYLFYASKELLLYDAFLQLHDQLHLELINELNSLREKLSVDSLTDFLFDFYRKGLSLGFLPLMTSGELDLLMRKLPDEVVLAHMQKDDDTLSIFQALLPQPNNIDAAAFSAAFRALFLSTTYQREIGEEFSTALRLLIRGLVLQMLEGQK